MKSLFPQHEEHKSKKVICLGLTFETEEERRAYFTDELKKKLPELRKLEGFPLGSDEDILALSDPPYYTACPNPFVADFIRVWEQHKREYYGDLTDDDLKPPFASDVSEGKNDPVYLAHTYHTKVPYKAIMRYLLHYTSPGDIVLDGFSGSGMTGKAASALGDSKTLTDAGYKVDDDGWIHDEHSNKVSRFGGRNVILNDLSPAAGFIARNFNHPVNDVTQYVTEMSNIIHEIESEWGWMYHTMHTLDGKNQVDASGNPIQGTINYTVWSDVFICPHCSTELVFWEIGVLEGSSHVNAKLRCTGCQALLTKNNMSRATTTIFDKHIGKNKSMAKLVPVLINYSVGSSRFEKKPDDNDLQLLQTISDKESSIWFPTNELPDGHNTAQPITSHGFTHTHHLASLRNQVVLGSFLEKTQKSKYPLHGIFLLTACVANLSWMYRWRLSGKGGILTGTYYICSTPQENNAIVQLERKLTDVSKAMFGTPGGVISVQASNRLKQIPTDSIDYIFTDPPFGSNLMYSELNFLWESWLKVLTDNEKEAIVNNVQLKGLPEYQNLMQQCFNEFFRVLKPGRWMTVEFSNSQASVWNCIQEALQRAGFVIANVSVLDKKHGSFKAVTTTTAVKQDLIISAYKPSVEMLKEMRATENTEESPWVFVRSHLEKLPVFVGTKGEAELIVERTPRILFDRMVAYHVQNGYSVPISSAEFQEGVAQRFPMRDGMTFLETQVTEYDKKRLLAKEFVQTTLFVSDENSAIEWLRQQLMQKPQTRQDLHPNFMKELQHISKHELLPELDVLLEQNFLMYDGTGLVPSQIHGYLSTDFKDLRNLEKDDPKLQAKARNRWYMPDPNKQTDLEKLREKSLLREFNSYIEELGKSKKRLRQFRTEAIRAGFKTAWGNQDYQTIVDVGQRLPEKVLQEDSTMLMYYDNAQIRLGM